MCNFVIKKCNDYELVLAKRFNKIWLKKYAVNSVDENDELVKPYIIYKERVVDFVDLLDKLNKLQVNDFIKLISKNFELYSKLKKCFKGNSWFWK